MALSWSSCCTNWAGRAGRWAFVMRQCARLCERAKEWGCNSGSTCGLLVLVKLLMSWSCWLCVYLLLQGKPQPFTEYLSKYKNTICGRHPIGIFLNVSVLAFVAVCSSTATVICRYVERILPCCRHCMPVAAVAMAGHCAVFDGIHGLYPADAAAAAAAAPTGALHVLVLHSSDQLRPWCFAL